MAAIFLIITSALWNLIFAVYESVTTIPDDLLLASQQFGLRGYTEWTRVVLPAVMHKLAYNSMISWANGWYFLIATEIIMNFPGKSGGLFFSHGMETSREGTQFCFFFTVRNVFECQQDEVAVRRATMNPAPVQQ